MAVELSPSWSAADRPGPGFGPSPSGRHQHDRQAGQSSRVATFRVKDRMGGNSILSRSGGVANLPESCNRCSRASIWATATLPGGNHPSSLPNPAPNSKYLDSDVDANLCLRICNRWRMVARLDGALPPS